MDGPGSVPDRPPGSTLIASIDVEWSKNYRIKNGNRAFCYSIIWLTVPTSRRRSWNPTRLRFHYTSAYLDHEDERHELVTMAAADLTAAQKADHLAGHQLCSDLAVMAANTTPDTPQPVTDTHMAWRTRRSNSHQWMIDTRFDAGHLLTGPSRRLVDVCDELGLDVTQPELCRTSMTALHRRWLDHHDTEARERITVLNLRHSLSTALVAARALGGLRRTPFNVNTLLAANLGTQLGWLAHPTFLALTKETPCRSVAVSSSRSKAPMPPERPPSPTRWSPATAPVELSPPAPANPPAPAHSSKRS
jgi:hypothetical protein